MLVCENRKYRDLNPYVNFITDKTNSDEFKQGYRDTLTNIIQKNYES